MANSFVQPGAWLGLLGGGQLGRMFTMAAQSMGYRVVVLDPGDHSPAGSVADRHIRADYLDARGLEALAGLCAGVTTEFENVPARALEYLASHCRVSPDAAAVSIVQDRIREKEFVRSCGIATVPFAPIMTAADLDRAPANLFPGILKVSRMGYDGKGQIRVADRAAARAAFQELASVDCVLEQHMPLQCELSVVIARDSEGAVAIYPVAENEHANGILDVSMAPARVDAATAKRARDAALSIANGLQYVGVLCVEFFQLQDGSIVVNEIAPRPHNSGHYTIDASVTSQFEQQARVLAGLPLGATDQHCPAVVINLLGDLWQNGEPDWHKVLAFPHAKLYLYGKADARPGRKMGHVTCLGASIEEALATAMKIRAALKA
ncbi:MAG: 5-(carboxyamino)imidazole ribonucleotide synthase [Betaproteobacteria bacterium]|nr:5-(carboxyamino)imidazole ribonucleotide synthase [Betaproteobacteria bacterium]